MNNKPSNKSTNPFVRSKTHEQAAATIRHELGLSRLAIVDKGIERLLSQAAKTDHVAVQEAIGMQAVVQSTMQEQAPTQQPTNVIPISSHEQYRSDAQQKVLEAYEVEVKDDHGQTAA